MTTTTTVPVSKLSGPAPDWAVAKCEWVPWTFECADKEDFAHCRYSSDWSLAGPIIEREGVGLFFDRACRNRWRASHRDTLSHFLHESPLIATMRCYVASKLGDTVEIPSELL